MDFKAGISTDTRSIGRGDVFFALRGENFDGHAFIPEAVARGASAVVYSDETKVGASRSGSVTWIAVPDTLKAYGDWAREFRDFRPVRTAAITGSSGKTTVKEMLAHVLCTRLNTHKNQGTENNLVGVPKTIFALKPSHEAMVLELGTNQPGEIKRLSEIASPDAAAITRIGPSHLEGLGSIEGVLEEKLSIAHGLRPGGTLWLNGDDSLLAAAKVPGTKIRLVGLENSKADVRAERVAAIEGGFVFEVEGQSFRLPCLGRHNILNALLVLALARGFGVSDTQASDALAAFRPVKGRLQAREADGVYFLDDTYNANPVSFEAALSVLSDYPAEGRKWVVAGDMLELGGQSAFFHRALGRQVAERRIHGFVAVGEGMKQAAEEALRSGMSSAQIYAARDSAEAGSMLRAFLQPKDVVLVKGSRGMKMEKVLECFTPSFTR